MLTNWWLTKLTFCVNLPTYASMSKLELLQVHKPMSEDFQSISHTLQFIKENLNRNDASVRRLEDSIRESWIRMLALDERGELERARINEVSSFYETIEQLLATSNQRLNCRGGVEDTRLEAKAKDSPSEDRTSRGQGQQCSRPRPTTQAQAFSYKKKVFKNFFQAISNSLAYP